MADFQKTIYEQFHKSNIAQELNVYPRDTHFFAFSTEAAILPKWVLLAGLAMRPGVSAQPPSRVF